MEIYRIETKVLSNGTLTLAGLPFRTGEKVEVIVRARERSRDGTNRYPLRGKPVHYLEPFTETQAEAIESSEADAIGVSAISCWEIAKLVERGRLELPYPLEE